MSGGERSRGTSSTRTNLVVQSPAPGAAVSDAAHGPADIAERNEHALADLSRRRSGLPSTVVHELRTPLTSIHGYAQVLQRSLKHEPRAANGLSVIVRETTRLSAMLAELSELAELESNEPVLPPVEVELEQVVEGVVHEVARRDGDAHPIRFAGSARVVCDPALLSQALLHILSNAVNYSDPGEPIEVMVRSVACWAEIVVVDRGIGVDPGDARRVYEPFARGANAREAGVRGLGLGLYLARCAMRRIGGKLRHQPRDGGGTIFTLMVPQA